MKIMDDFYEQKRSNLLPFVLNDPVEIVCGQYKGNFGSVISICEEIPNLVYLVELGSGVDVKLPITHLKSMEV